MIVIERARHGSLTTVPLDIGIEYLFGNRINNDGSSGYDNRVQVSLILHFGSGPQARSGSSLIDRLLGRE